jgi:beta-glucosidase
MTPFAELVLPAIRWDRDQGFTPAEPAIEHALARGVGGFIVFGGERTAVQALTRDLRAAARGPLLVASDFERGAGQQVRGCTALPPAMALAGLGEPAVVDAARITAREARDLGVNWALAPVCDLDIEAENPIVQTRSFGADADTVAALAAAWIAACQAEGVLACAKHFPGHGRTARDSHAELPVVEAGRDLLERDLTPFRRAVAAGVAAVMTAHVAYPAWDPSGTAATTSRLLLRDVLREDLFFPGLTVTDALVMEGARHGRTEAQAAVAALRAGCDVLLYPQDADAVLAAIAAAVAGDGVLAGRAAEAAGRLGRVRGQAAPPAPLPDADQTWHRARGHQLAMAAARWIRGDGAQVRRAVTVEVVDDDAGGPYPLPPRTRFVEELTVRGAEVRPHADERIVLLFADVKSWKGRAALSRENRRRLEQLLARPATVVLFGHPRRLREIPGDGPVLCAWSGDEVMQAAAAKRLLQDGV